VNKLQHGARRRQKGADLESSHDRVVGSVSNSLQKVRSLSDLHILVHPVPQFGRSLCSSVAAGASASGSAIPFSLVDYSVRLAL
jgi:hypothetical protein